MVFDQRDHALIVATVCIMEICFVHQNHRLPRSFGDELTQAILWRDTGGGNVRGADVNKTLLAGGCRCCGIITEPGGEGNFSSFPPVCLPVIYHRPERGNRDDT